MLNEEPIMNFSDRITLGRTGLTVGRIGLAAGYNAPARAYEEGFEKGCNYFYWLPRRSGMKSAIRNLLRQGKRDRMVLSVQTYYRSPRLIERSLEQALKKLALDHVDVFMLGWRNRPPAPGIVERVLRLKEVGKCRFIGMSGHQRSTFPQMAEAGDFDIYQVRYNAAHRGAETEVFPYLGDAGVISFTATRWGHLLKQSRMPQGEQPLSSTDCYRFVLSNPRVHVCLSGPGNLQEMREALRTLESPPLAPEEMERIRRIGDHVHQRGMLF